MKMCAAPDCDRPVGDKGARGFCSKHYKRLMARGDVTFAYQAPWRERFQRYFTAAGPDECWKWSGGRDRDGYGMFSIESGRPLRAHRVAIEFHSGEKVQSGFVVCHSCDNPPCVNPRHLFIGTIADNNADRVAKGRSRWNETGNIGDFRRRLTEEQVAAIRLSADPRPVIARAYGISREHVRRIKNGTRR